MMLCRAFLIRWAINRYRHTLTACIGFIAATRAFIGDVSFYSGCGTKISGEPVICWRGC